MAIKDILDVGTPLLGGIFSGIGAKKRQDAAIKAQREENEKARNWQQKMAEWQVGIERENLADERAYNNPSAVMKRLKDAGLNPDLMYGNGASGLVDGNFRRCRSYDSGGSECNSCSVCEKSIERRGHKMAKINPDEADLCCDSCEVHENLVKIVNETMPDETELYDLAELFKVFGDSTRIQILFVLFEAEVCVCDLAEALHMTQSAISHQLRILKQNKLVKSRREGKSVFYSLADGHVRTIIAQGQEHIEED